MCARDFSLPQRHGRAPSRNFQFLPPARFSLARSSSPSSPSCSAHMMLELRDSTAATYKLWWLPQTALPLFRPSPHERVRVIKAASAFLISRVRAWIFFAEILLVFMRLVWSRVSMLANTKSPKCLFVDLLTVTTHFSQF